MDYTKSLGGWIFVQKQETSVKERLSNIIREVLCLKSLQTWLEDLAGAMTGVKTRGIFSLL